VDDEITPSPSGPQVGEFEGRPAGGKWKRWVYTDEVFWRYDTDAVPYVQYYNIAAFPFVPGYFVCKVIEDEDDVLNECHFTVAGPFPTLKAAKAAVMLLGASND
jgi:hypothetical protein